MGPVPLLPESLFCHSVLRAGEISDNPILVVPEDGITDLRGKPVYV